MRTQGGAEAVKTRRVSWRIHGLGCGGAALSLERVLERLPGMVEVYVNPATEIAYIEYQPRLVGSEQIVGAIEGLGYRASDPRGLMYKSESEEDNEERQYAWISQRSMMRRCTSSNGICSNTS